MLAGRLGGQLLVNTLNQLANGTFTPVAQPTGGSYQPWPQAADFRLSVSWTVRRGFNFMRGTAVFGQPFTIELADGEEIGVQTAVSFSQDAQLSQPVIRQGNRVHIQFGDGVLVCSEV
jgi:methionyl-tRNA formyltransferase